MTFTSVTYVEVQWIELTGLFWDNDQQSACFQTTGFFYANQSDNLTLDNLYIHNWTHGTSAGTTDSSDLIAFTTYGTPPYCFNCTLQNSVIDNSDGDGSTCGSGHSMCSGGGLRNWNLQNNVIKSVVQGFISPIYARPSVLVISGNNMSNIDASFTTPSQGVNAPHPNCIETTGVVSGSSGGAALYVHDNYIHNISECEGMQVGNPNEDDYVWNNIWT